MAEGMGAIPGDDLDKDLETSSSNEVLDNSNTSNIIWKLVMKYWKLVLSLVIIILPAARALCPRRGHHYVRVTRVTNRTSYVS